MRSPFLLTALTWLLFFSPVRSEETWRSWTSAAGTQIEAKGVALADGTITLMRKDGSRVTVKVSQLSDGDRAYVRDLQRKIDEGPPGEASISGIDAAPGERSGRIGCLGSEWGYYVYLPKAFHSGKLWPVFFLFSPDGGNADHMHKYLAGAERTGSILVMSAEARNGFADSYTAGEAMIEDVFARFPVTDSLCFVSGFSGGSRAAYYFAEMDGRIDGVLACGSGWGIYVDGGFRQAKLRAGTQVYSLIGTNCFNRYEAVKTHQTIPEDFPLQFFPGNHDWAHPPFIEQGMAHLYGTVLKSDENPALDPARRIFSRTVEGWIGELRPEEPWRAHAWAKFLKVFPGDPDSSEAAEKIFRELDPTSDVARAAAADQDIADFAVEHYSGSYNLEQSQIPDPKRMAEAQQLATKHEGMPHAEVLRRLGGPVPR